jgi:hypothetical protein
MQLLMYILRALILCNCNCDLRCCPFHLQGLIRDLAARGIFEPCDDYGLAAGVMVSCPCPHNHRLTHYPSFQCGIGLAPVEATDVGIIPAGLACLTFGTAALGLCALGNIFGTTGTTAAFARQAEDVCHICPRFIVTTAI